MLSLPAVEREAFAAACRYICSLTKYSTWMLNLWMSSEALTSSTEDREEEWLWGCTAERKIERENNKEQNRKRRHCSSPEDKITTCSSRISYEYYESSYCNKYKLDSLCEQIKVKQGHIMITCYSSVNCICKAMKAGDADCKLTRIQTGMMRQYKQQQPVALNNNKVGWK